MPLSTSRLPVSARFSRARVGAVILGGSLAIFALAGCAPEAGAPTAAPTASPGQSEAPSASATPTPTPTPTPSGTPVALECDQVLTPDDIYAFNPNFGSAPDYEPENDSLAETATSYEGIACGWLSQTSGEIIEVAIAQPNEVLMNQLKDAAIADSTPVPTYGTPPTREGFFSIADGPGEAQVFTDRYWVTVRSTVFAEPGDPRDLVETVMSHLPQTG